MMATKKRKKIGIAGRTPRGRGFENKYLARLKQFMAEHPELKVETTLEIPILGGPVVANVKITEGSINFKKEVS